jgi:hypothetical protein
MFLSMMHQAAASFYMEQNANQVLRMLGRFDKAWDAYVVYVKRLGKNFDLVQQRIKSITTGKIFTALEKTVLETREAASARGVDADRQAADEIDALIAELEDDEDSDEA